MVEQNRRQTVPAPEPDLVTEECDCPLNHRTELAVAVRAMESSIIVVVDEKRSIGQNVIIDPGLEKFRERTPRQRGVDTFQLPSLRNMIICGHQWAHTPSSPAPYRARGA